jgi:hypothetical protein
MTRQVRVLERLDGLVCQGRPTTLQELQELSKRWTTLITELDDTSDTQKIQHRIGWVSDLLDRFAECYGPLQ